MANRYKLTILYDAPFWVGVYERMEGPRLEACKIIFGSEPKDYEVYDFFLRNWNKLDFSPSIFTGDCDKQRINPKRMQRKITRQLQPKGIGTKAQQALKLMQEQGKIARKSKTRRQKEEEKKRQFAIRQEKKKEKHKGH